MLILDAHAHCGLTLTFERLNSIWKQGGIDGGVIFSPVEEIYDRADRNFIDSEKYKESRRKVHEYLRTLKDENIYIYWFVWNDFMIPWNDFCGIKWHRHASEPNYQYEKDECKDLIEYICANKLPVLLEEEFSNTIKLIDEFRSRTTTIIPHMGSLNGGYSRLKEKGIFENPSVYVDTSLASPFEIKDFAENHGTDRMIFGSDYPFGDPVDECMKIKEIFSGEDLEKILAQNILRLIK
ncbi:amidohydrolase family protein [Natranaerofaba carboxydovora]|uniref:amidohydrolase family protein n=1 Tax=Natranaerofaba carboxydovora TaxID=2742683 RepID=UPI001F130486|nr:amidohydrolase family protein [Natranaerofaba carboxydovora]UMZ74168.1 Amidohydrolase [Natranaerofaba carboxydovora]